MSVLNPLGFGLPRPERYGTDVERIVVHRPLGRIFSFIGRDIDDLVNDSHVKGQVYGYYKLQKQLQRGSEVSELERTWNKVGMRYG